jgi:hypothetical protein
MASLTLDSNFHITIYQIGNHVEMQFQYGKDVFRFEVSPEDFLMIEAFISAFVTAKLCTELELSANHQPWK